MSVELNSFLPNQKTTWYSSSRARAMALRALQRQLESSQWLPPEVIDLWQRQQLGALLAHASAHSPYYKRRLSKLARDFEQDESACLRDIPVLSRDATRGQVYMHSIFLPKCIFSRPDPGVDEDSDPINPVVSECPLFHVCRIAGIWR